MEKQNFSQFNQLQSVRLSPEERSVLLMKINATKNQYVGAVPNESRRPVFTWVRRIGLYASPALAMFVLLIGSANALPGQQLYSVKTNINEPLERLVSIGADEIEFEKKLINRRVNEARTLRSMGLLDVIVAEEIEENINKQASKIIEKNDKEHAESNNNENEDGLDAKSVDNKVKKDVALAELKGVVSGSVEAVRIMAGKPLADAVSDNNDTTINSSVAVAEIVSTDDSNDISAIMQPYEPAGARAEINSAVTAVKPEGRTSDQVDSSPEVVKARIQAEAKIATTKAEVTHNISKEEGANFDELDLDSKDSKQLNEIKVDNDTKAQLSELTEKKIQAAKKVVDQDLDKVDELQLLDAVEDAAAARTISEALLTD